MEKEVFEQICRFIRGRQTSRKINDCRNLGVLYENLIAQMIAASGRELYYHTWEKANSTHYYEIDFLVSEGSKMNAFEVKSSGTGKHESIKTFYKKFYGENLLTWSQLQVL